jgi:glutamate-5-semialdehyde dehydrogenase
MAGELEAGVQAQARAARKASRALASATRAEKDAALLAMAEGLERRQAEILAANQRDLDAGAAAGLSKVLLERLMLNPPRVAAMAQGLREVAALPDPCGQVLAEVARPNGIKVQKLRVPLGVVAIVYESRPNVTVDAAGLCLKAGNAVVLRGGKEAIESNKALGAVIREALQSALKAGDAVQMIETTDRAAVAALLHCDRDIDVVIPRGGQGLIAMVRRESSIPVISHGIGNCHVYVDASADLRMAEDIVFNAKTQRPGVCNAMEHLLVAKAVAPAFVPRVAARLKAAGVALRGDRQAAALAGMDQVLADDDAQWDEEYLDLICGIKVVEGLEEAIAHINRHGSGHSDAIVTRDAASGERFLSEVDSAAVYVNASTRFTDGSQFGLGAEIGISTQKLHARGPMGLEELCSTKFVVRGDGQVRD